MEQIASTIPAFKGLIELQQQCAEARELGNEKYEEVTPLLINEGMDAVTCLSAIIKMKRRLRFEM